jgi:hypothetical protein
MREELATYLSVYGAAAAVIRPAIVLAILAGLWIALRRTNLPPNQRATIWAAISLPLVSWLVVIWNIAAADLFRPRAGSLPWLPFAIVMPLLVGLPVLMRSQRVAAALDAATPAWLVGLQAYRVMGGNFIVLWGFGAIPGAFALPAGIGDVVVGLLALPVAFYLASGAAGGRVAAIAWNLLGVADLISAVTLGALTSPGPLQRLAFDHPNLLTGYPTVMTPAFAVPLSLILHGLSLRQLLRLDKRAGGAAHEGSERLVQATRGV